MNYCLTKKKEIISDITRGNEAENESSISGKRNGGVKYENENLPDEEEEDLKSPSERLRSPVCRQVSTEL